MAVHCLVRCAMMNIGYRGEYCIDSFEVMSIIGLFLLSLDDRLLLTMYLTVTAVAITAYKQVFPCT